MLLSCGETLAHDGVGDDAVDLDGGDVVCCRVEGARDVPAAAGSDDQGLGAGADGIGQCRALQGEIADVVRREVVEIELGDGGGGVGIDHDLVAAIGLADDADAREDRSTG